MLMDLDGTSLLLIPRQLFIVSCFPSENHREAFCVETVRGILGAFDWKDLCSPLRQASLLLCFLFNTYTSAWALKGVPPVEPTPSTVDGLKGISCIANDSLLLPPSPLPTTMLLLLFFWGSWGEWMVRGGRWGDDGGSHRTRPTIVACFQRGGGSGGGTMSGSSELHIPTSWLWSQPKIKPKKDFFGRDGGDSIQNLRSLLLLLTLFC